jgi:hypothetical protein
MPIDQQANIRLEPFTAGNAWQAHDLSQLVLTEEAWLKDDWPGVVERYANKEDAYDNIRKRAGQTGIQAFLVRQRRALGIATIVFDQQVNHPVEGSFAGNDIDYWLQRNSSLETHQQVVRRLVGLGGRRGLIATVVQIGHNPALGFDRYMQPIGDPSVLSTDIPDDPFNVARDGKVSQLYYLPMP